MVLIAVLVAIGVLDAASGQAKPTAQEQATPTTSQEQAKPTTSREQTRPTADGQAKPTTSRGQAKSTTSRDQAKPTKHEKAKHTTHDQAKPTTDGQGQAHKNDKASPKHGDAPKSSPNKGARDKSNPSQGTRDNSNPNSGGKDTVEPWGPSVTSPVLAEKVLLSPPLGIVLIKPAHHRHYQPLTSGVRVPVGSVVDARAGAVGIVGARDPTGSTQVAIAAGGAFLVRQAPDGRIKFVLRGSSFRRVCGSAAKRGPGPSLAHRATSARRHPRRHRHQVVRSLWTTDNHGLFSTQGLNSVATVRGTTWVTEDRCDGTLTIVIAGQVAVRDRRRHRVVVVSAGHEYLARNGR